MKMMVLSLFCSLMLLSCSLRKIPFEKDTINVDFVQELIVLAGGTQLDKIDDPLNQKVLPIDTTFKVMKLFEATLVDDYVVRDGIMEETVIRDDSTRPVTNLPFIKNTYKIYIVLAWDSATGGRTSLMIPAIFNGLQQCIGLGPAWAGTWGAGDLRYFKKLRYYPVKRWYLFPNTRKKSWVYLKKESEYGKNKSIHHPKLVAQTKINIILEPDTLKNMIGLGSFSVRNIYNAASNSFGGHKALQFDIEEIFKDKDALKFVHVKQFNP